MPNLFIIAGCNGAGKTTASYTILPELLGVKEFVNADEIARGLSPFQPETVAIQAGKIMLRRLQDLLLQQVDFAFETTLSTRSFMGFIKHAKEMGYTVNLVFYWLESVELAIERVETRVVVEGGHNIPIDTIIRRYYAGLHNFVNLYKDAVDYWMLIDNSKMEQVVIAKGRKEQQQIINTVKWLTIQKQISNDTRRN